MPGRDHDDLLAIVSFQQYLEFIADYLFAGKKRPIASPMSRPCRVDPPIVAGNPWKSTVANCKWRDMTTAQMITKLLILLVIPTGIEPVTYRLGICRSILLSYGTTRPDT